MLTDVIDLISRERNVTSMEQNAVCDTKSRGLSVKSWFMEQEQ